MFVAQLNGHYLQSLEEAVAIQMQYVRLAWSRKLFLV